MEILYQDNRILVCIKPAGILSTDEPGGMPGLLRAQLGDPHACVRTVHRLDRVVGGVMVLARSREAARRLSDDIRSRRFEKEYLAAVHGRPEPECGTFHDLLLRSKPERKTYVVYEPGKDVQNAVLDYRTLSSCEGISLVKIRLKTGRTHQIRAQFSAHGYPLVGDHKYGAPDQGGHAIALWSCRLAFEHPQTEEPVSFTALPPQQYPWTLFPELWTADTAVGGNL
ncbi:MAG: RluA family pseudouridine synthase [Butyricicoccaceae bacterium]